MADSEPGARACKGIDAITLLLEWTSHKRFYLLAFGLPIYFENHSTRRVVRGDADQPAGKPPKRLPS